MKAKRHTLAAALRVAAEQYDADAATYRRDLSSAVHQHFIRCFEDQTREARALADAIEQADVIKLED